MSAFFSTIRRFRRDKSGNIAIIFALTLLPVLSAVGCAIDYSRATQLRSKLQAAADAASVGSIARNSPAYLAAGTMTSDGPISAGVADATNIFNGNMSGVAGYTLNSVTPVVARSNGTVTSSVQFSANVPTMFLGVMGKTTMTVGGTSTSTANIPLYIDFYLLLDNSPSMGVGATPTDVSALVSATSAASFSPNQNCAFACHDLNSGATDNFYALAKTLGANTRLDVLRLATQNLMSTASSPSYQVYPNQFRMAIYDFGISSATYGLTSIFSLSSNLSSAQTAAQAIDLMGVYGNNDQYTADQDSQFTTIFPQINNAISSPGTGGASDPLKYLFFVSDGVADESNAGTTMCNVSPSSYPLSGNRCQSPINPALCTALKNRGIKIAVLYTTYLNLPTNAWYMTWLNPFNPGPYGPSPNSQIALNMQACASDGLYFEVSPTQGISDAMTALFRKAVADARISG
jgi:Flp pilus assembly protein TadG